MKKDNKALNDLDQELNKVLNTPKNTAVKKQLFDDLVLFGQAGYKADETGITPLTQVELQEMKYGKEHNLFMHSQVPEVEPEDTNTIHPDYQGIPMVANVPFKEPTEESFYGGMIKNVKTEWGKWMPKVQPIKLVVLGEPKSQKRHRHVNMGKFTRQYDPSANDKGDFLSVVQKQAPEKPIDVPVRLCINFYFTRPKSHYKTGKNAHILKDNIPHWHTSKPDTDNCFKFVTDALNKVFWRDDSLICDVTVQKQYSDQPRIEITIQTL